MSLFFFRLALQNCGRRPGRALLLALALALGSGVTFVALVVGWGLDAGVSTGFSRMGADLLIVPRETLVNLTSVLLTVEPTTQTFEAGVVEEIGRLPGVRRAAPQRIFRAPAESTSCRHEVDLIAFDPGRDFTVLPWVKEKLDRPMRAGDVLIGARREYPLGEQLTFYGQPLTVYGRLARTGVGPFDHAFFLSFDSVTKLAEATSGTDAPFAAPTERVSAVLVQLDIGASAEQARFAMARIPDVKVAASGTPLTGVRQGVTALFGGMAILAALMLAGSVLLVGVLSSAILGERRRELGLLLAIGARPRQIIRMIVAESMIAAGLGGLAGVLLGVILLGVLRRSLLYYLESIQVAFAWPTVGVIILMAAGCLLLAAGIGLLGALLPAQRLCRQEIYGLLRAEG